MQLTPRNADYNRLMQASRERSRQLRREAAHEFWSYLSGAGAQALRSARRYASALTRHPSMEA